MIYYTDDPATVREDMLDGFFAGWPRRPSAAQHLAALRASYRSVVAIDTARSAQSSRGRGFARRSTATSCRSTSSSASLEADDRPSRTSQPQSRTKMR
jgi:hypothetical protein